MKRDYSKPHWADKPILRDFFWFLVLPHRFGQWLHATAGTSK
jgi:hypothetical protein